MNLPWVALRYFISIGARLCKISIKLSRTCWHSILFISCLNISEISVVPIVYYFWFWLRKILFQNCGYKLVKINESRFKHTAILETTPRVCYNKVNTGRVIRVFKTCLSDYMYSRSQKYFFSVTSLSNHLVELYFHNLYRVCPKEHLP